MKKIILSLFGTALIFTSILPAMAELYVCSGTIDNRIVFFGYDTAEKDISSDCDIYKELYKEKKEKKILDFYDSCIKNVQETEKDFKILSTQGNCYKVFEKNATYGKSTCKMFYYKDKEGNNRIGGIPKFTGPKEDAIQCIQKINTQLNLK